MRNSELVSMLQMGDPNRLVTFVVDGRVAIPLAVGYNKHGEVQLDLSREVFYETCSNLFELEPDKEL